VTILAPNPGVTQTAARTLKQFNAAVAEASADIDPDNFDEDFEPLEDKDSHQTKFDTPPEMETIHHDLGF
jgi:hypothetical protein